MIEVLTTDLQADAAEGIDKYSAKCRAEIVAADPDLWWIRTTARMAAMLAFHAYPELRS